MRTSIRLVIFTSLALFGQLSLLAQAPAPAAATPPPNPNSAALAADHGDMMKQLGITKLRPGPSGTAGRPNPANYDPRKADPFPDYPEILTLKNGQKVTTAEQWWNQRRPEIVEDFEREVIGRVPKNAPSVKWEVKETVTTKVGEHPVVAKLLVGHVGHADEAAHAGITGDPVDIQMVVVTPEGAKGVPVLMMFGGANIPGRAPAGRGGRGGRAGGPGAPGAPGAAVAVAPATGAPAAGPTATPAAPPAGRGGPTGPSSQELLIAAGWGYVGITPGSIQADNGAGLTKGVIGLVNKGGFRKPDDWGALRAWGWGASRGLDYLETDPAVDAKRVGIEGVSRYGKAALVTMAFDQRFAVVLVGSSGEGGAKPHRRNFGEAVENLTAAGEYHWMAGNFIKYGAEESSFGSKNAGDIPVDSHQLIALCAPRPTFISYGVPERGDANWLDQRGSYMATVAAGEAFRLLGVKDLGETVDYRAALMPSATYGKLDGQLAWRQHEGGHEDRTNMPHFITWASKQLKHTLPEIKVASTSGQ
ncbi:MAG: acetylxylan esterase [Opitutaceae bacterium]